MWNVSDIFVQGHLPIMCIVCILVLLVTFNIMAWFYHMCNEHICIWGKYLVFKRNICLGYINSSDKVNKIADY